MATIRLAQQADAPALAAIAELTFRDTFGPVTPADDMAMYCAASYGADIQAREIVDPNLVTSLAEIDGVLAGYSQWRRRAAIDCVIAAQPSELSRIYVVREWHGHGVAQELMRGVLSMAMQSACDVLWLGVWEHNIKAQTFYRKFGFETVGEHIFAVGSDPQRDVIMSLAMNMVR